MTAQAAHHAEGGPVLTVEEAAAYLRISRGLAFAAVKDGSLPCVRIGRRILIPRRQLEALLDGCSPSQLSAHVTSRSLGRSGAWMGAVGRCAAVTAASKVLRSPSSRPGARWT